MSESYENELMDSETQEQQTTSMDLYLVFRVEDQDYAINVAEVTDILPYDYVRPVPRTPAYMKGIMNLRGDIIPVICVRSKFMKPEKEYDFETCIIKVQYEDYALGLIVDKVLGVETIHEEQITPPPSAKLSYANQFIKSVGSLENNIRMILNLEKLIF